MRFSIDAVGEEQEYSTAVHACGGVRIFLLKWQAITSSARQKLLCLAPFYRQLPFKNFSELRKRAFADHDEV
jgi:hypothetical protein